MIAASISPALYRSNPFSYHSFASSEIGCSVVKVAVVVAGCVGVEFETNGLGTGVGTGVGSGVGSGARTNGLREAGTGVATSVAVSNVFTGFGVTGGIVSVLAWLYVIAGVVLFQGVLLEQEVQTLLFPAKLSVRVQYAIIHRVGNIALVGVQVPQKSLINQTHPDHYIPFRNCGNGVSFWLL